MASGIITPELDCYKPGDTFSSAWIYSIGLYTNNGATLNILMFSPKPIKAKTFTVTTLKLYLKDPDGSWVVGRQSDVTSLLTSTGVNVNYVTFQISRSTVMSSAGYCVGQIILSGSFS